MSGRVDVLSVSLTQANAEDPACADQGGPKARTEEQRLRALELVDAGWSWAQAAREVGVPKTTVQTWIKKRSVA